MFVREPCLYVHYVRAQQALFAVGVVSVKRCQYGYGRACLLHATSHSRGPRALPLIRHIPSSPLFVVSISGAVSLVFSAGVFRSLFFVLLLGTR